MSLNVEPFKSRVVQRGDSVRVYYDLHSGRFSVQKGSRVHGKSDALTLTDVEFRVNENARLEVIASKRKNVHAKVHGTITTHCGLTPDELVEQGYREATYNPYKYSSFVDKETETPLSVVGSVVLYYRRIFYRD